LLGVLLIICVVGCSGGDTSGIAQNVADAWPAKWCQAEPGITKEQLAAIMGPSTGASATHMSWSAHQYQFNAFLDPDGTVTQLDINLHSLSDAEKAALQCDNIRTKGSLAASAESTKPERIIPKACALVSEAEMSAIMSAAVATEAIGDSTCIYRSTAEVGPIVELTVRWGEGAGAMRGMGMANQSEPGLASPYVGIGDEAAAVGTGLMIRTGEDLVTILFGGVSDVPAPSAAKKIFDTAKPRMGN
jgi:hypothetical protein